VRRRKTGKTSLSHIVDFSSGTSTTSRMVLEQSRRHYCTVVAPSRRNKNCGSKKVWLSMLRMRGMKRTGNILPVVQHTAGGMQYSTGSKIPLMHSLRYKYSIPVESSTCPTYRQHATTVARVLQYTIHTVRRVYTELHQYKTVFSTVPYQVLEYRSVGHRC
jgi:hypothetical protein